MDGGGNGERRYNKTFERLVDESKPEFHDIQGMVAYSLYKREKGEWAKGIHDSNGRGPERSDLDHWESTIGEKRVNGLRQQAEEVVNVFAKVVIDDARPEIEKAAIRGKFLIDVGAGILAALIYTVLLIAFAVVLKYFGIDLLHTYEKIGAAVTAESGSH